MLLVPFSKRNPQQLLSCGKQPTTGDQPGIEAVLQGRQTQSYSCQAPAYLERLTLTDSKLVCSSSMGSSSLGHLAGILARIV